MRPTPGVASSVPTGSSMAKARSARAITARAPLFANRLDYAALTRKPETGARWLSPGVPRINLVMARVRLPRGWFPAGTAARPDQSPAGWQDSAIVLIDFQ